MSVCRAKIPHAAWWGQTWQKKEAALAWVTIQTLKLGTLLLRGSSGFQLRVHPIAHNFSPFSLTHLPLSSFWFKFSSLSYHLGTWLNAPSSRKPSLNALGWMKCFLLSHSQRVLITQNTLFSWFVTYCLSYSPGGACKAALSTPYYQIHKECSKELYLINKTKDSISKML